MSPRPILIALAVTMAVAASSHALLFRRDPRGALGWIVACILMPVAGPILYFAFGINRVQRRARRLLHGARLRLFPGPFEAAPALAAFAESAPIPPHQARLRRAGRTLSGKPALPDNAVVALRDGDETFPAMLRAIDAAQVRVWLQTYIFEADEIGERFVHALTRAAERGLDVRVLVDGVGSRYGRRVTPLLRSRGVAVAEFLPVRLFPPTPLVNLRNHRKILAVDGELAFTGGINIGARHMVAAPMTRFPTAEMHFELRGPIVDQLDRVFAADWTFATGDIVPVPEPRADAAGDSICRVITDGPDDDIDKLLLLLLAAVAEAEERIAIVTPYFLPPRELLIALGAAALRGVRVDVLIPARSNLRFVDFATRNMLWEPLQRGVRVYEAPPPFDHTKLFLVDDAWTLLGSANLDPRSLRLNFELGVEVYDAALCGRLTAWFDERVGSAREITLAEVDSRSIPVRFRDSLAWLAWPYL